MKKPKNIKYFIWHIEPHKNKKKIIFFTLRFFPGDFTWNRPLMYNVFISLGFLPLNCYIYYKSKADFLKCKIKEITFLMTKHFLFLDMTYYDIYFLKMNKYSLPFL